MKEKRLYEKFIGGVPELLSLNNLSDDEINCSVDHFSPTSGRASPLAFSFKDISECPTFVDHVW